MTPSARSTAQRTMPSGARLTSPTSCSASWTAAAGAWWSPVRARVAAAGAENPAARHFLRAQGRLMAAQRPLSVCLSICLSGLRHHHACPHRATSGLRCHACCCACEAAPAPCAGAVLGCASFLLGDRLRASFALRGGAPSAGAKPGRLGAPQGTAWARAWPC
jgi:hypothetical protein